MHEKKEEADVMGRLSDASRLLRRLAHSRGEVLCCRSAACTSTVVWGLRHTAHMRRGT